MSNSRSFRPALICDTLSVDSANPGLVSLASLASRVLADGVQAFVLSNRTLYRLSKNLSTPAPGDLAGGQLGALGGGVWAPIEAQGSAPSAVSARNTADKAITLTGVGNFLAMPSSAATFASVYDSSNWVVDAASGQLTYNGPSGQPFFFSISASMYNGTTVIDTLMGLKVGSTVLSQQMKTTAPVTAGASSFYNMTLSGMIASLDNGSLIDVVFAGESSTLTIVNVNYSLFPMMS